MYYDFICKNCGNKEVVEMKITEYTSKGHTCSKCQSELERDISKAKCISFQESLWRKTDISSMKYGMVKDMSGGFYKQVF